MNLYFDPELIKNEFPILENSISPKNIVYLDSAASSLRAESSMDAMNAYYSTYSANVHRGVHLFSEHATEEYEGSRLAVKDFLNAKDSKEIVFTSGTTHAINLVALGLGKEIKAGDSVLITGMEHHSNIVPWQMLCERRGARLEVAQIHEDGSLDLESFEKFLSFGKVRIASFVALSNTLGTLNPVKDMVKLCRKYGAMSLVDGAQYVAHYASDMQDIDCDFFTFSGHKVYGPTGVGVLYGKESALEKLEPSFGGGDMIRSVSFEKTSYAELPYRLEAGTPPIAEAIGLGAALKLFKKFDFEKIRAHDKELIDYSTERMATVEGLRFIGNAKDKSGASSFIIKGIHPHDLGSLLSEDCVAVRTGHHCTQPLMDFYQIPATARASFGVYNDKNDVDKLVDSLQRIKKLF